MNKVALITGGAKRIGLEIAKLLWSEDWDLIIHYRSSQPEAELFANEMNEQRVNSVQLIQADLDNAEDVKRLIVQTIKWHSRVDALINNASTFFPTPLGEINENNWEKLINSNLKAPLFLIDGLADELKKNHGNIINITDMNIEKGLPNHAIYIAAKAGLEAITKVFARDLAPAIKVNAVAPGAILEPPGVEWSEDVKKKILRKIPLNRMGNEKDIAEAVLFLINSPYITGQTINVDGGRSIG